MHLFQRIEQTKPFVRKSKIYLVRDDLSQIFSILTIIIITFLPHGVRVAAFMLVIIFFILVVSPPLFIYYWGREEGWGGVTLHVYIFNNSQRLSGRLECGFHFDHQN